MGLLKYKYNKIYFNTLKSFIQPKYENNLVVFIWKLGISSTQSPPIFEIMMKLNLIHKKFELPFDFLKQTGEIDYTNQRNTEKMIEIKKRKAKIFKS